MVFPMFCHSGRLVGARNPAILTRLVNLSEDSFFEAEISNIMLLMFLRATGLSNILKVCSNIELLDSDNSDTELTALSL